MATLFRYDSWTKSANGAAIAGAQIYVLNQPASLTSPPTPQLQVFADPLGINPITQPMITDGFGHVSFYVINTPFTLAVYYSGVLQNSYADQFGMGAGSGGSGGGAVPEFIQPFTGSGTVTFGTEGALNTFVPVTWRSGGDIIINLPDATLYPGQIIRVAVVDATYGNNVVLTAYPGQYIGYNQYPYTPVSTYALNNEGQCVNLESDGELWAIIATAD